MVAVAKAAPKQSTGPVRPEVMREFRKHTGSTLSGLFGAAAFDEVALVPVAAAVDKTGRFDDNFADRGVRGGFSALLALWGDAQDRAAEADRLKRLHRDVRGHGQGEFTDVRYSALNPRLWNWIAVSGIFLTLNSFTPCTGITLSAAEQEAAYQLLLESFRTLELPGKNAKLPASYADAVAYYEDVVANELQSNPFLRRVTTNLTRLPLPTLGLSPALRFALTPAWLMLRPVAGHVLEVCSFGIIHPAIREMTGFKWQPRHTVEFEFYTRLLQLAWRVLPDQVLLIPLARNRLEYEKLVHVHRKYELDNFGPPSGCPVAG